MGLSRSWGRQASNMGANSSASSSSAPIAGQPKAMASKEPTWLAENHAAAIASASAPASWAPAATCRAICSVLPVPLQ